MSMRSWSVNGWGILEDDLCPSTDDKIAFVKKYLPKEYEAMQKDGKDSDLDMSNTADYLDFCERWMDEYEDDQGYAGFGPLFALAIQENEDGFYAEYFNSEGYGAILYEDRQPWEMTERVKAMKAEDMTAVFQKYLSDLKIDATVERQFIEYYG